MVGVDPTLVDPPLFGISLPGLPALSHDAPDKFGAVSQAAQGAQAAVAQIADPQYAAVVSAVSQLAGAIGNGTSITDVQAAMTSLQGAMSDLAGQSSELTGSFLDDLSAAAGAIGTAVQSWVSAAGAVLGIHDGASAAAAADAVLNALGDTSKAFGAAGQVVKDVVPGTIGDVVQAIADAVVQVGDVFNQLTDAIVNPAPPDGTDTEGHPGTGEDDHPVNPGGLSSDTDDDGDGTGVLQGPGSLIHTGGPIVSGTDGHPTSGGDDIIPRGVQVPVSAETIQAGGRAAG